MLISSRFWANSILLLVTLIWGATFTLTKSALTKIPVFPYLTMRFLLATLVMSVLVFWDRDRMKSLHNFKLWMTGTSLGVLLFLGYALQTLGLQTIDPAVSAFLTGLSVILVPIMAIFVLRQQSQWRTWIAAVIAAVGLGFLNGIHQLGHFSIGTVETLACAVFLAMQIVAVDKWAIGYDSISLTTIELLIVTLLSFVMSVHDGLSGFRQGTSGIVLIAVIVNGLLGTAFAYWAQLRFQRLTSASYVAVIFTMEPVFAAGIAFIAYHEMMGISALLGGALIVASMLLADAVPNT
ncbi:DMT family transporter [Sulfobacillus thermosulfidooxidans]|uniref:DMT family transporter n=1 Tax=Sulfobacillus thermosulfidooxidans TaxID=28034 RepID=UPI0009FA50ED|nr:DMT family transporter [Sulfobacillus thermosulfidooxidans]